MEETKKQSRERKKLIPKKEELASETEVRKIDHKTEQILYGWVDAMEVAKEVWKAGNIKLLEGDLIFGYKNTGTPSELHQLILVRYFVKSENGQKIPTGEYGLSIVTAGYSCLLPRVNKNYLKYLYDDIASYKLDKNILMNFRNIIEDEIISN